MFAFLSANLEAISETCQAMLTFQPAVLATKWLLVTLVVAFVVKIIASVAQTVLLISRLKQSNTEVLKVNGRTVHLFQSSGMNAFVAGIPLISNQIFVSETMRKKLSDKELEAVVLHEAFHQERFHLVTKFVFHAVSEVLFFIPVLKDLLKYWELRSEIAADTFATTFQGSDIYLKSALAAVLTHQPSYSFALNQSGSLYFAEDILERRVHVLTKSPSNSSILGVSLRLLVSCLALLGILFIANATTVEATFTFPSGQCQQILESRAPQQSNHFSSPAI